MNPEGGEKEKPKKRQSQPALSICAYLLVFLFLVWWLLPLFDWGFHLLRWIAMGIENYEIVLDDSNLLSDTEYTEPYNYQIIDEEGNVRGNMPSYVFKREYDGVRILFEFSLTMILNPFSRCRVSYDSTYSFPDGIHCARWHYLYVRDFEPLSNSE